MCVLPLAKFKPIFFFNVCMNVHTQEHHNNCKYGVTKCPNSTYGCKVQLARCKVDEHLKLDCQFNPVTCRYCGRHTTNEEVSLSLTTSAEILHLANWKLENWFSQLQAHIQRECDQVLEHCPNGCGERLPRREVRQSHVIQ